jgi:hypothetical protein
LTTGISQTVAIGDYTGRTVCLEQKLKFP